MLSLYSQVFGYEEKKVLEIFVIIMYDRSSSVTDIDSVRLDMFASKQKSYDALPAPQPMQLWTITSSVLLTRRLHLEPSNNS